MVKSEASLTGFAVSPRIARTLQRCENFTCARVFPTSISTYLSPGARPVYFFSPPRPRTNSAFNCARRANDIFLLLLCPRSHRIFRFNKISRPRRRRSSIVRRPKYFEEAEPRESESDRVPQNLISEKKSRDTLGNTRANRTKLRCPIARFGTMGFQC